MKRIAQLIGIVLCFLGQTALAQTDKPNIVLINMDNFGFGELGVYGGGITRGAPTPRIDKLAGEGLRLTNFNLYEDPKEMYPWTPGKAGVFWVRWAMGEILNAHGQSLATEPPIKSGTPDPYIPAKTQ